MMPSKDLVIQPASSMSATSKRLRLACLLFATLYVLVGCSVHKHAGVSDQQRSESFKTYRDAKIGAEPLGAFLKQRTAVLVSGWPVAASKSVEQSLFIEFKPEPNRVLTCGHAAAIDSRGYFLTAAHCLEHPVNYLVYSDGQSARIAIPRIVAKMWDPAKNIDLAIIHVDAKLRNVFALATPDEIHAGEPALTAGSGKIFAVSSNLTNWGLVRSVCLAGRVAFLTELGDGIKLVCSDIPSHPGDSGSPLVSTNGTLMGVHSGVWTDWRGKGRAVANRPSDSWLSSIIEEDRQRLPQVPPLTLAPLASFDKEKAGMVVWLNYEERETSDKQ